MREIKFRAWGRFGDAKEKAMVENWQDTNLVEYVGFDGGGYFILMQYTGLKDKNGDGIYEGDVVKDVSSSKDKGNGRNIWEIIWRTNGYLLRRLPKPNKDDWDWTTAPDGYIYYDPGEFYDCKVIGNIYENPELLKSGQ